ncbi:MAG TPA: dihydroorotate dehydrogenase-like protein [Synergistales bacterium]|nr:dihydroorotate dehydrogenase-like protein [Synergistales bacterium]
MANLEVNWMGLKLASPIIAGSSPLTGTLENLRKLEKAGAGAAVLPSLFEEQLAAAATDLDKGLELGTESYGEALSFFPDMGSYNRGRDLYLELIRTARKELSMPIIASLNGIHPGSWCEFGRAMQDAGADALELNLYVLNTDPAVSASKAERDLAELVRHTVSCVTIPVSVKLAPFYTALPNLALKLKRAGARGLVLFNRFYNPDLDLEKKTPVPRLSKTTQDELWLRLRWSAILYGRVKLDLALSGGVSKAEDAVKALLCGASVVQVTSALYEKGPESIGTLVLGLDRWLEENGYSSAREATGSLSQKSVEDPGAFERANYLQLLRAFRDGPR